MSSLLALPSDISNGAAYSVVAGSADADYPVTNLGDGDPSSILKATGTSITVRLTFGGSKTIVGVVLANTNATVITLSNNGGMTPQDVPDPTLPEDTLPLDPWKDITGVANNTGSTWDVAFTVVSGVVRVGEILLVEEWQDLPFYWSTVTVDEEHKKIRHETDYGFTMRFGRGVRIRGLRGRVLMGTAADTVIALERDTRGGLYGCVVVENPTINDALYAELTGIREITYTEKNVIAVELAFRELSKGLN